MISENTLRFLQELMNNNEKKWFDINRKWYEESKNNFKAVMDEILNGIAEFEPLVKKEPVKSLKIFRINRDIRFSKDKSPYKTNFGGAIVPGGMNSGMAGYYLHLEHGGHGIDSGHWEPTPEHLAKIRKGISKNYDKFLKVIEGAEFKKLFGSIETTNSLKTPPRGFSKEDPAIEYLKLKSFTVWKKFDPKEVLTKDFVKNTINAFKVVKPFNDLLNSYIAKS